MTQTDQALRIDPDAAKSVVDARLREVRDRLVAISYEIHAHPELAFEERRASELVATELEAHGFDVTRGAYGVETAVEGVYGSGRFRVVICAEYDALPELGHACSHNLMAASSLGTALALQPLADELDLQIVLLGTPAEEHGGGKVVLLRNGAFEGAVVSGMVHGSHVEHNISVVDTQTQCVDRFEVTFTGRAAHAAAAPYAAINAGAAATLAQVAVGLLRQQLLDGVRLAVFTKHGGEVTNIIPGRTVLGAEVRAYDVEVMSDVKRRVLACMEGAAIATECTWEQERSEPRYLELIQDPDLSRAWDANMERRGLPVDGPLPPGGGSTDMGNVSYAIPSIHPILGIAGAQGPPHTIEFAAAAGSPAGETFIVDAAAVLAWSFIDVASDPQTRADLLARAASRAPGETTRGIHVEDD